MLVQGNRPRVLSWFHAGPMLFGDYFGSAIYVEEAHNVLGELAHEFHGSAAFVEHGVTQLPFFLAMSGVLGPWQAAFGMALSSVVVVINASRTFRFQSQAHALGRSI